MHLTIQTENNENKLKKKLPFSLILIAALILIASIPMIFYWISSGEYYGRKIDRVAPDFQLVDTQMNQHRLSQHKGKFVFLYFGYLNCNDVCHNQVGVMFNINNQTDNKDIDFIFVTMDPSRDSPEMLNDYFNQFGSNFFALTGASMAEIQKVASLYKAYFFADGATQIGQDYEISHPGSIFLIDPDGNIQVVYQNIFLRYDKIIEDLNRLRQINRLKNTESQFE